MLSGRLVVVVVVSFVRIGVVTDVIRAKVLRPISAFHIAV